jgi:hypothetical protein
MSSRDLGFVIRFRFPIYEGCSNRHTAQNTAKGKREEAVMFTINHSVVQRKQKQKIGILEKRIFFFR